MTLKIGTLCYLTSRGKCPGCSQLAGRVVEIVAGPLSLEEVGGEAYQFAPELVCPYHNLAVCFAHRRNLVPIAEPPTVDVTDRERKRVA